MAPNLISRKQNRVFTNLHVVVVLTLLCENIYELREKVIKALIILLSGLAAAANFNAILAILLTYSHRRQKKLLTAQINNSSVKIARINRSIKWPKRIDNLIVDNYLYQKCCLFASLREIGVLFSFPYFVCHFCDVSFQTKNYLNYIGLMCFDNFLALRLDAKQLILKNDGKVFATLAFRRELSCY